MEVFSYVYTNSTCVSVRMLPICRIRNGATSHGPLPSTRGHSPKCRREAVDRGSVRVGPARMHECTNVRVSVRVSVEVYDMCVRIAG